MTYPEYLLQRIEAGEMTLFQAIDWLVSYGVRLDKAVELLT